MEVHILNDYDDLPRHLLRLAFTGARGCYSEKTFSQIWEESKDLSEKRMLKTVEDQVLASGHLSVLRHCALSYGIDGISRACAQQLTRHTAGLSFEMQSQRYCQVDTDAMVIPPDIEKDPVAANRFQHAMVAAAEEYHQLLELGIEKEDARFVIPLAAKTNLIATINFNALINLCHERLCTLSQYEIRRLTTLLRAETLKVAPWLRRWLVIKCMASGVCFESRNRDGHCKIRPHISAVDIVPRASAE